MPGEPLPKDRPLGRFLPPIEVGAVTRWLQAENLVGRAVVDPFGTSPWLPVEAAKAGAAVLVAVNNPVTRFVLERYLDPLTLDELQSTLAQLATAEKGDQRLESFLLDLYRTRCSRCHEWVSADYFVWQEQEGRPLAKGYACPHCHHAGEEPTTPQDQTEALRYENDSLAHARALEEVAPLDDPNRAQAEAALSVYPGRALYAVVTLINNASQLNLPGRQAVALQALLLSALDSADSMWAHPEGRPRPKQLSSSPMYRESNLWRSLERGVEQWTGEDHGIGIGWWPESQQLEVGAVTTFAGSVRQLAESFPALEKVGLVTVPPRPNQAYWTLSALWAAWIWGREAAEPLRAALRRRRYDWGWHAQALRRTAHALNDRLKPGTQFYMFIPEAEPGYLGACLAGFDASGQALQGRALRQDAQQAQLRWRRGGPEGFGWNWQRFAEVLPGWLESQLQQRGQPTHYLRLHFGVASAIASERGYGPMWHQRDEPPVSAVQREVEETLTRRDRFHRLDQRQDPETGLYWLTLPRAEEALVDRVERRVLMSLRGQDGLEPLELDAIICQAFPGLLTPDLGWVVACAESYAQRDEEGYYRLRPEDQVEARAKDLAEIRQGLRTLGERLGYRVSGQDPIHWREGGTEQFSFCVLATSILGEAEVDEEHQGLVYVLPGGRAALIAEKARRDPRLAGRLESGLVIIKFRHVRRLLSDTTLARENFLDRLTIDPPEQDDPQLPLL
ncbi:MAG: hypothetical protein ACLFWD_13145 [Anaerolineales bacterium]